MTDRATRAQARDAIRHVLDGVEVFCLNAMGREIIPYVSIVSGRQADGTMLPDNRLFVRGCAFPFITTAMPPDMFEVVELVPLGDPDFEQRVPTDEEMREAVVWMATALLAQVDRLLHGPAQAFFMLVVGARGPDGAWAPIGQLIVPESMFRGITEMAVDGMFNVASAAFSPTRGG